MTPAVVKTKYIYYIYIYVFYAYLYISGHNQSGYVSDVKCKESTAIKH